MTLLKRVVVGFVIVAASAAPLTVAASATAVHRVTASISLSSSKVEMRTPLTISACVAKVPTGSKAVLQEAEGTGHVWHTVYTEAVPRGRTCFTDAVQLTSYGQVPFRVAVVTGKSLDSGTANSAVTVYGPVPLAIFFQNVAGWDNTGSVVTPGHTYAYLVGIFDSSGGRAYNTQATTTCRSVTLTMVMSNNSINYSDIGNTTLSIQQNSLNEQTTPAFPDEQPFTYTFNLDGSISSWLYEDDGTNPNGLYFLSGTADCSSPSGA
jgi:hypothetical protein